MKRVILAAVAAAVMLAQTPQPAPPQSNDDQGISPDHGVARLSLMQGSVSVRHGDDGDLTAAALNAPVLATDRVLTGDGSRAEIEFDSLNTVRLGAATEVRLSELQYKLYQVQIAQGTVMFHVARDNDARAEISTPTVLVRPAKQGSVRVTVNPDGTTQIDVRSGQAEVFGPNGSELVNTGQTMLARGSAADPEVQVVASGLQDDFDRWNADRDRTLSTAASPRYVSPDVPGTESLDQYGRWQNDPQYGNVWVPSAGPNWAPYQDGRWVWVDYYGWTWMGAEPWAYAPYHYGWWYPSAWGWAWWPGPVGVPYYWRPAMVGFFGWGGGYGFGFGFGFGYANVGWVALAPHEVFHPWYGHGYGAYSHATVVNNVNITNTYRNATYRNAIGGMRAADFGRGAVTSTNMVRASTSDLARAGAVRGAMPFTPAQNSRRFSDAAVSTRGIPQTRSNLNFSSAGSVVGSRVGNPGAGNSAANFSGRSFAPPQQGGPGSARANAVPNAGNGGWRSFNPSAANPPAAQSRPGVSQASPGSNGGWRSVNPAQPGNGQSRGYTPAPQQAPRYAAPPQQQAPRYAAPQQYNGPRGGGGYAPTQRLQINPPIVRERGGGPPASGGGQARGNSGGSRGGSGGGGGAHGGGHR